MNFYKRYPGDYGRDTAHLSLAEHGAYALLIDHCYSTERPLPADYVALFRICRAFEQAEQHAVRAVADQFFPIHDDGLRHNARIDRQLPEEIRGKEAARENGKKGGRPKSQPRPDCPEEPKNNPVGFVPESQQLSQSEPSGKTPPTPYPNTPISIRDNDDVSDKREDASSSPPRAIDVTGEIDAQSERAIELTLLLRKRGAALQASDPNVRRWAAEGVSDAQALSALEIAQANRAKAGSAQQITAAYLNGIIANARASPADRSLSGSRSAPSIAQSATASFLGDFDDDPPSNQPALDGQFERVA